MATLTIVDAARLTGVSRSQLYRYIRSGKLSRTPEGLLDTAELLRAGLMLHLEHVPSVSSTVPETHDATLHPVSPVPEPVPRVPSPDTAPLERLIYVLQRELTAAREREVLLTQRMHERETQLTQAAHESETLLLQLMAQMQQQNTPLLDLPRSPAIPPPGPQDALGAPQPPRPAQQTPFAPQTPPGDPRGAMRRRIVTLLRDHPEGLTPAEIRDRLGMESSLGDTLLGMLRYGLVQRVERGRYVNTESPRTNQL